MEQLTNVEELIMKCIWRYGKEMPFLQLGKELKEKYDKDYKRTSVRTYLFRLEDKGYIKVEERKRRAYINTIIDEESYKKEKAGKILEEWFDGSAKELLSAISGNIKEEETKELKDILDGMEFKQYFNTDFFRISYGCISWDDPIHLLEDHRKNDRKMRLCRYQLSDMESNYIIIYRAIFFCLYKKD